MQLTRVAQAHGQWDSETQGVISENSTVLVIYAENKPNVQQRVANISESYRNYFRQDSVLVAVVPAQTCFAAASVSCMQAEALNPEGSDPHVIAYIALAVALLTMGAGTVVVVMLRHQLAAQGLSESEPLPATQQLHMAIRSDDDAVAHEQLRE